CVRATLLLAIVVSSLARPRRVASACGAFVRLVDLERLSLLGATLQILEPAELKRCSDLRRRFDLGVPSDVAAGVLVDVDGPGHVRLHAPRGAKHDGSDSCRSEPEPHALLPPSSARFTPAAPSPARRGRGPGA